MGEPARTCSGPECFLCTTQIEDDPIYGQRDRKGQPSAKEAPILAERFDDIFGQRTRYKELGQLLAPLHRRKAELLKVLERPEIPLHTNSSENDLRACVTKRRISGGTMSAVGRQARDVMLGLMKTCQKLGISFFAYLGDRLGVKGLTGCIPFLQSSLPFGQLEPGCPEICPSHLRRRRP
ncbi:IS66 family transposase [Paracoccus fontiphilus]|uniref:Transposase n=1 Tax=Paracoccus fontiphilus TaxID=1815556 RepID=A0ABV7IKA1_9RHOB|nr:transposase [Paracoccus fontiphilus]